MKISITAQKTDIQTLTCILRRRLSPASLPYPLIASKLLTHMLQCIYLLQKHTIFRSEKPNPGFILGSEIREWVERYLEERFEVAEKWENESWMMPWDLEDAAVEEIIGLLELKGEGNGVWGEREREVQREWRRSGDWRAGSTPCFCGKGEFGFDGLGRFGAVGCEREEALRVGALGGERGEVEEERAEEVMVGGDTAGVVDEQRDLEERLEEVSSSGRNGVEKILMAEEVAPPPLKDVPDRIRVPRVLKRGEKISDNWREVVGSVRKSSSDRGNEVSQIQKKKE